MKKLLIKMMIKIIIIIIIKIILYIFQSLIIKIRTTLMAIVEITKKVGKARKQLRKVL